MTYDSDSLEFLLPGEGPGMRAPKKLIAAIRFVRFVVAAAMLCAVVAGALGYGDDVKLTGASIGATAAVILKVAHFVA